MIHRDQPPDDPYRVDDAMLREAIAAGRGGKVINAGRDAKVITFRRLLAIIILMLLAYGVYKGNESFQESQKAQQETAAKHEASLQTLKKTDVSAYLAALKKDNDSRWESEFKVLDPRGYEAARKTEIANLMLELKNGAQDVDRFVPIYKRLNTLDPTNDEYRKKLDYYSKRLVEMNALRYEEKEQRANPEKFVTIEQFSWSKGGFNNVMIVNFSIKNSLPWPVKDVNVRCQHSAPSGTAIDSNNSTIYERIEAKKTKHIANFNMGFIHSQAKGSYCTVVGVVVIK